MKDFIILKSGKIGKINKPKTIDAIVAGLAKKNMKNYALLDQEKCSLWTVDETGDLTQLNKNPEMTVAFIIKNYKKKNPEPGSLSLTMLEKLYEALDEGTCKNMFTASIFNDKDEIGLYTFSGLYRTDASVGMEVDDNSPTGLSVTYHIGSKRGVPMELRMESLGHIIDLPAGFGYVDRIPRLGNGEEATKKSIRKEAEMYEDDEYTEYEYSTYLTYWVEKY